ncbi:MAG: acetyl-CoA hydrolase/transferase family protein [Clostridiales bacterium]|nr:acetyl-CoA hydrolase/transferase family protein [Clostridiales bacterium]
MDWQKKYASKLLTADEAAKKIHSGDKILLQQGLMLSEYLVNAILRRKNELKDLKLFSSVCYCKEPYFSEEYKDMLTCYCSFLSSNSRAAYRQGRIKYTPLFFKDYPYWIKTIFQPDVFLIHVTPPDENGNCSFSLAGDWSKAGMESAKTIIAQINPLLPRTDGIKIHMDQITWAVEHPSPLKEVIMGRAGETEKTIAGLIAPLIQDGACLQAGIGGIPDIVLSLLKEKNDLGIHTELLTDGIVDLCRIGVINNKRKNICSGVSVATFAVGSKKLFEFIDHNPTIAMLPVDFVNNPRIIAQNDNVISINSCLQVDLLGQVNADTISGAPYSGIGGQADFVRGASMSKGGKSFLALPSIACQGAVSRIVPFLPSDTPVTTSRFDVQYIVTEYGIADLWGKSMKERAKALIDIAHPKFRSNLEQSLKTSEL